MNNTANSTSLVTRRCYPSQGPIVSSSMTNALSTSLNLMYLSVLYLTFGASNPLKSLQSLFLASVTCSSLTISIFIPASTISAYFTPITDPRCSKIKEVCSYALFAGYNSLFANHMILAVNRYIACQFPLQYTSIMTRKRALISMSIAWGLSYTLVIPIFFEEPVKTVFLYLYPNVFYIHIGVYALCVLVVSGLNFHMWLLGFLAYRKEQRTVASLAVNASFSNTFQAAKRDHLKIAMIAFILPIKNIIFLLPVIVITLLRIMGYRTLYLRAQPILRPFSTLSDISDPIICTFIIKEARLYVLGKLGKLGFVISRPFVAIWRDHFGSDRVVPY